MATTTNLKDVFSTTVTDCFVNQVASHLSEWLKTNKSVDVSTQDLCSAFNVPYTPRSAMAGLPQSAQMGTQMPQVPGYYSGTGGPSPARKGGRKKAPVDPNAPRCIYKFQRGAKKGETCDEVVVGDDQPGGDSYCKSCIKKKTVQNKITSGTGGKSTVQPPVVPGGMVPVPDQEPSGSDSMSIDAVPLGPDGMYRDVNNGYIIKAYPDGTLVALSIEDNGVQRPLTDDERKKAQTMGLSVVNEEAPASSGTTVPTIPTIPTNSAQSSAPVPQVPAQSSAPVQQVPSQVPQVPQAVTNSVPQVVPQVPNVPQVPQVSGP